MRNPFQKWTHNTSISGRGQSMLPQTIITSHQSKTISNYEVTSLVSV